MCARSTRLRAITCSISRLSVRAGRVPCRQATGCYVPLMAQWTKPPFLYVYVLVVGGVLAAITTALLGDDGVDWPLTILITLGILVGTVIGQVIKTRRTA
jgi:hypothetical protein